MCDALTVAGYDVVAVASLCEVAASPDVEHVDVLILDASVDSWLRAVSDLRHTWPAIRIVMVGSFENPDEFLAAVSAGVDGFCPSDSSVDALIRTVQSVEEMGVAIPRSMVPSLVEHVRHGRGRTVHSKAGPIEVTDREWEILTLLVQRRSTKEMADALFVSVGTVRSHVSTLMKKLGAVDRDDVIAMINRS